MLTAAYESSFNRFNKFIQACAWGNGIMKIKNLTCQWVERGNIMNSLNFERNSYQTLYQTVCKN